MVNAITKPRDLTGRTGPGGSTVVQVSDYHSAHLVLDTVNTAETSISILNSSTWREAIVLINVSAIAGTTPQLIFNVWQLDQTGNRYPAPAAAPANNGFLARTITTVTRTRDILTSFASAVQPIGSTVEITFNTGTSAGAFSATVDIEIQFKSA
jgi:threonine synthase